MEEKNIASQLRHRLSEYRFLQKNGNVNIHLNAVEIALCLFEYAITKGRSIQKDEEGWFAAGFHIDMALKNSEWEDIADLYYKVIGLCKKNNYYR